MLEICALNESKTKLSFHFVKEKQKIILGSKSNLIETIFPGLKMLYFKENHMFSIESTVGHLISNDESVECLCGSIFPISILSNLCESSLKIQTILAFIQVCKCFQPDLYLTIDQKSINNNMKLNERILQINQFQRNTELPGNFIWSLLVLSEIFNFHQLLQDCINKLAMIVKQHYIKNKQSKSPNTTYKSPKNTLLPLTLVSDISQEYISTIESNIVTYLTTYTMLLENSPLFNYNSIGNFEDKSLVDTVVSSNSCLNTSNTDKSTSSSTSRNISISYDHVLSKEYIHNTMNEFTYMDDRHTEDDQLGDGSINSFVTDTSDLSMTPVSYILPPPVPQNYYRNNENTWQIYPTHDIKTNLNSIDTLASINKNYSYNVNLLSNINHHHHQVKLSLDNQYSYQNYRENNTYNYDNSDSEKLYTLKEEQLQTYEQQQHMYPYIDKQPITDYNTQKPKEQVVITAAVYDRNGHLIHNNYSNINTNDNNNNNELKLNSPHNKTPMKMKISKDIHSRACSPAFGSSTPRSLIETNNNNNNKSRFNCSNDNNNNTKGSYSDFKDIPLYNKYPNEEFINRKEQLNKSITLSPEDLRISREIALLRLKEAKVKEEIEISRIQAEKGLRENHLKALALKASIARVRNTNNNPAPIRSTTSITLPNISMQKNQVITSSSSIENSFVQQQNDQIAEARLRAAQRVRETRKTKELNEKKQNLLKNQLKDQKWILRDKKIEQFQLKQNQHNNNNIHNLNIHHNTNNKLLDHALFGEQFDETNNSVSNNNKDSFQNKGSHFIIENEDEYFDQEIVNSGLYSKEALAAVGLGYSPNSVIAVVSQSPTSYNESINNKPFNKQLEYATQLTPNTDTSKNFQNTESSVHDQHSIKNSNKITTSSSSSSSSSLISPIKLGSVDIISIKVLRAWGLPESLGGTNAYVVLDWGQYGKSSTQAVNNSIEPNFGATLQFKSPYQKIVNKNNMNEYSNILHMIDFDYISNAGPLKVYVYTRNHSISDELIAWGEIDPHEYLRLNESNNNKQIPNLQSTCVVHLFDPTYNNSAIGSAGSLEYMIIPYFIS